MTTDLADFPALMRYWRQYNKLSQLDLALDADISQRHISYLETGRSKPSRDMIARLGAAMDIPLRDRNALLVAAGFAPEYQETALDSATMAPVLQAVEQMLAHHAPLPALAVDRNWTIIRVNKAAELLIGMLGDLPQEVDSDGRLNLAYASLHPMGLRRYITNWAEAGTAFLRRLRREALATRDPALRARFDTYASLASAEDRETAATGSLTPVLPVNLDINGLHLSLFTVISTFGTPQDVTTDELRVESFYAMDEQTSAFFAQMAG